MTASVSRPSGDGAGSAPSMSATVVEVVNFYSGKREDRAPDAPSSSSSTEGAQGAGV